MWCFILKNLFKFAEQFGRGGPADAEGASQTGDAYSFQNTQDFCGINIGCELVRVKGNPDLAVSRRIIDFIGAHCPDIFRQ